MTRDRGGRSYWGDYYEPSQPREVKNGIKARSRRGKFGETWWADRWIAVLESFGWSNRLQRGRNYARWGQVIKYEVSPGTVRALVQGSRPKPYQVRIDVKTLSEKEWDRVTDAMAAQAIFAAKLLAGEMPRNIEDAFSTAKLTLFPESSHDLKTECSCPDWANPCKHIAAVHYLLAEEFDRDPFMIFRLRGRTQEDLTSALRHKRSVEGTTEIETQSETEMSEEHQGLPLQDCIERFWTIGEGIQNFRVSITPPTVPEAILKRLGPPPFWNGKQDFVALMKECYQTISNQALKVAYSDRVPSPPGSRRKTKAGKDPERNR